MFATQFLKVGVILHGIVTIRMFTNSELFPEGDVKNALLNQHLENQGQSSARFSRAYATWYIVFYIGVCAWFLFEATLLDWIPQCFRALKEKVSKKTQEEQIADQQEDFAKEDEHSNDFFNEISVMYLRNYEDDISDEKREFKQNMDDVEDRFDESKSQDNRFEEEVKVSADVYNKFLIRKESSIHYVIE